MTTTETKVTYTQGEWRAVAGIDEWLVMSPLPLYPIARIGKQTQALEYGTNRLAAEEEANARLIASSPDLLKACKSLLRALREYTDGAETTAQTAILDSAELAIAKATA